MKKPMSRAFITGIVSLLVLIAGFSASIYYQKTALENQLLIWDAAAPDTVIESKSNHIIETHHYYIPVEHKNQSTIHCDNPYMNLHLNRTVNFIGTPVEFTVDYGGCIQSLTIMTQGLEYEHDAPYGAVVYYEPGRYRITAKATFEGGSSYEDTVSFALNLFEPPHAVPNPNWPIYDEWNWFRDHPNATIELDAWLSDAEMWHNRATVESRTAERSEVNPHPGYKYGIGGVTVNTFVHTNVKDAAGAELEVSVWGSHTPHGSCMQRYEAHTILIPPPGPRLWISAPMGCNLPDFTDGIGYMVRYEHDGHIMPKWTPWYGPEGMGYLFDAWDHAEVFEYGGI